MDDIIFESIDPIEIANILFSNEPKNECSIQLCDVEDIDMLFEILITILMEGIEKINFIDQLDDIDDETLSDFLINIKKWFISMGFTIHINKTQKNNKDDYYCKIITKNGTYGHIFMIKNIDKNYSFLLNPKYIKSNEIFNTYAIYVAPEYKLEIKFKHHIPELIKLNMIM